MSASNPSLREEKRGIKELNAPQAVSVQLDEDGLPASVRIETPITTRRQPRRRNRRAPATGQGPAKLKSIRSDGDWMTVAEVEDIWKINAEWWRGVEEEIERLYFALILDKTAALKHAFAIVEVLDLDEENVLTCRSYVDAVMNSARTEGPKHVDLDAFQHLPSRPSDAGRRAFCHRAYPDAQRGAR